METLRRSPVLRATLSLFAIAMCLLAIGLLRQIEPEETELAIHGAFDVTGHVLTAAVAAIGVRALRLPVPAWAILVGGVVLDLGHVLGFLGYVNALEGSSRNGSHSLFVVVVLACLGFADQRRANLWLGVAMGATSHLWRDMGTGTVALLWPLRDTVYGTSFNRYVAVLAGMSLAMIGSAALLAVHARSRASGGTTGQAGPTS